ncbi:hypothetical protein AMECASPLE_034660 [Ameca splendens]|uniref:Uncharacterized protein n=1 Tax=Ameca splendens TaxID=208324 RepID=A0ABV1AFQ5_9TELE
MDIVHSLTLPIHTLYSQVQVPIPHRDNQPPDPDIEARDRDPRQSKRSQEGRRASPSTRQPPRPKPQPQPRSRPEAMLPPTATDPRRETAHEGGKRPQAYLHPLKWGVDVFCCSVHLKRKGRGRPSSPPRTLNVYMQLNP